VIFNRRGFALTKRGRYPIKVPPPIPTKNTRVSAIKLALFSAVFLPKQPKMPAAKQPFDKNKMFC